MGTDMTQHVSDTERALQAQLAAKDETIAVLEASNRIRGDELARLRSVEPPGWREALQFYADRSHFVIADADAWDTVSGEPSNFWCDDGTATVEDGTVAKMALAGTPLSDEDDGEAAPPAQPAEPTIDEQVASVNAVFDAWRNGEDATLTLGLAAQPAEPVQPVCSLCQGTGVVDDGEINCYPNGEPYENGPVKCVKDCPRCANKPPAEPVQRLSDEQIDAILHEAGVDEFAAIPIEYDRQVARAIESALQPGWRDIESAPKDGKDDVWLHADGKVLRAFWVVKPYRETRDLDGNYIDHQDYDEFWMSCADGDEVEDPTEWQPIAIPAAPKATK